MEDKIRQLLFDLAEFIRPIANGNTESPSYVQDDARQLIERISQEIDSIV